MATLLGPLTVIAGTRSASVAVPVNLLGSAGTIRLTINGVVLAGDATAVIAGSDDGLVFTTIATIIANDLFSGLNPDGVADVRISEIPVPPLPANLKFDSVSTATFTLLVEQV
jgi:hypothetical protein